MVYYWNLVRRQFPNIQVRLEPLENIYSTSQVGIGQAIWLSCGLEDKSRENRLYIKGLHDYQTLDAFLF